MTGINRRQPQQFPSANRLLKTARQTHMKTIRNDKGIGDGQSHRSLCIDESWPNKSTVFRWLAADEAFRCTSTHARPRPTPCSTTSSTSRTTARTISKKNADATDYEALIAEHIQRSKLRVDARKWMAGKLQPMK
ncbi:hypothetical protein J1C56_32165 [Aminobacter anthyllidis]|uniref:Uncharacterized protein n=1 Tax=Aminobacter anthyllidis TaxID=1035067 RepID=A0A9X1D8C6_9HYPH|nr:hypothetical protein [Aminobacter anthyllidis]MBT1160187.1 hypothetical protein [Aminobacter anthyllidis]